MVEAVDKFKRMLNPKTVDDYGLTVSINDLIATPEGKELFEKEIAPYIPVGEIEGRANG